MTDRDDRFNQMLQRSDDRFEQTIQRLDASIASLKETDPVVDEPYLSILDGPNHKAAIAELRGLKSDIKNRFSTITDNLNQMSSKVDDLNKFVIKVAVIMNVIILLLIAAVNTWLLPKMFSDSSKQSQLQMQQLYQDINANEQLLQEVKQKQTQLSNKE